MPCENCKELNDRVDSLFAEGETICAALEDANTEIERLKATLKSVHYEFARVEDICANARLKINVHV